MLQRGIEMDHNEMIGFIVEQFNANHYGEFIKDGKVFSFVTLCLVPNGIDIEMTYRPTGSEWCEQYPFEEGRTQQEALVASYEVMVGPAFWRMNLEPLLTDFADVCFDRFKDWTARSITKTDTTNTRVIHVRFELPKPMSKEDFTKWATSQRHPDFVLAKVSPSRFDIPVSVLGACTLKGTPYISRPKPIPSKHDWTPRHDRVDRYNSGSYSDYDEWCDYLDEVCGRD